MDEVRPRWIVGENVAGLASLGLDGVLFDLEASGYACETVLLPACGVGAPHRRDRLWIVAHAGCGAGHGRQNPHEGNEPHGPDAGWPQGTSEHQRFRQTGPISNAHGILPHGGRGEGNGRAEPANSHRHDGHAHGYHAGANGTVSGRPPAQPSRSSPEAWRLTEPPLCGPDDGLPAGLVRVSTRAKQLKAYGNSIVPQVAYELFQAIALVDTQ
ncbi:DNA cytosine methyltransferase [Hymenobacter lapidiphilus]|uniref:DNA cytosine methyltransferase n=1 Tax=Hymenobacter lapidiphilus TaxID=2608003 RepID=UPI003742C736